MTELDEIESAVAAALENPHAQADDVAELVVAVAELTGGIQEARDLAQGERIVRATAVLFQRHFPDRAGVLADIQGYVGCLVYYQGRDREARPLLLDALAASRAAQAAPAAITLHALAVLLTQDGGWSQALDLAREGRALHPDYGPFATLADWILSWRNGGQARD